MRPGSAVFRGIFSLALLGMALAACAPVSYGQGNGYERSFPQSKATIEKMLQEMPTAGRLPVLDGFAISSSADHPLERYRRGYYESKFQVSAAPGGGSVVRVVVQVTAWYADPVAAKSGYQLLTSNGRIEGDVLDQLADQLAANTAPPSPTPAARTTAKVPGARSAPTVTASSPISPSGNMPLEKFVDSLIGAGDFGAGAAAAGGDGKLFIVSGARPGGSGKESSSERIEES